MVSLKTLKATLNSAIVRVFDNLGSLSLRTTVKFPQSTNLLSAGSEAHKRIFTRFTSWPVRIWFLRESGIAAAGAGTESPLLELELQFPESCGV